MNDVSRLTGAAPVIPSSNRVRKSPHKQRPTNRQARGKHRGHSGKEDEQRETAEERNGQRTMEMEVIEEPNDGDQPLSYGSNGLKKPRNHKVDLVI